MCKNLNKFDFLVNFFNKAIKSTFFAMWSKKSPKDAISVDDK